MPFDPARYYEWQGGGSFASAQVVAPLLIDLLRPTSVVDVGCGVGTWLRAFSHCGVSTLRGIDREWVPPELLQIPKDRFAVADLERPLPMAERFDLAVCLEVAEHLRPSAAETLVASLTALAPAVAFSAAIPLQGGSDHVNCRWQSYWADLFRRRGYEPVDCIRHRVWQDQRVEGWYSQNLILYCHPDLFVTNPRLKEERDRTNSQFLDVVHPSIYFYTYEKERGLRDIMRSLPQRAWNLIRQRWS